MTLFGTSGVRGIANKKVTPELALKLGKSLGTYLLKGEVVVGRDTRTTSEMLEIAFASGLIFCGIDVFELGVVPTPTVGICVKNFKARAGVMITASHNPPQYNGIKVWGQDGLACTYEEKLESIFKSERFKEMNWREVGNLRKVEGIKIHKSLIKKNIKIKEKFKVVLDCGNGSASVIAPQLFSEIGLKVLSLNANTSGFFSRSLEPTQENLKTLSKAVEVSKADLGFAYDGDADRVGCVDEHGSYIDYDTLLALISRFVVKKKMVTTLDASLSLREYLKGCKVLRTKIGDKYVARELLRSNADFGGEPSGTWIFPKHSLTPDGIFSSLKILEMKQNLGNLCELREEVPSYYSLREKIPVRNSQKKEVMKRLKKEFEGENIITLDGVFLEYRDSFLLIRASGTEPYIRVRAEARDERRAKELLEKGLRLVRYSIDL